MGTNQVNKGVGNRSNVSWKCEDFNNGKIEIANPIYTGMSRANLNRHEDTQKPYYNALRERNMNNRSEATNGTSHLDIISTSSEDILKRDNEIIVIENAIDQTMGGLLAKNVRDIYGKINRETLTPAKEGDCVIQKWRDRTIIHLLTRKRGQDKTKIENLRSSLVKLKNVCLRKNMNVIHMPIFRARNLNKISFHELLINIFSNTGVKIILHKNVTDKRMNFVRDNNSDQDAQLGAARGFIEPPGQTQQKAMTHTSATRPHGTRGVSDCDTGAMARRAPTPTTAPDHSANTAARNTEHKVSELMTIEEMETIEQVLTTESKLAKMKALGILQRPGTFKSRKNKNVTMERLYDMVFPEEEEKVVCNNVLSLPVTIIKSGKNLKGLLDTGCNVNLVKFSAVNHSELKSDNSLEIIAANGTGLNIKGKIKLNFEIGDLNLTDEFYAVEDLQNNDIIFGNKFMYNNQVIINFKKKNITITSKETSRKFKMNDALLWKLDVDMANNLHISERTEIFQDRELIIQPQSPVVLRGEFKDAKYVYTDNKIRKNMDCHLFLDEEQGKTNIVIFNASSRQQCIPSRTLLGFYTKNDLEGDCSTDEPSNINNSSYRVKESPLKDRRGTPIIIAEDLTVNQRRAATDILKKYFHMFTTHEEDLRPIKVEPVKINLKPGATPVRTNPYRINRSEQIKLDRKIDSMVAAGVLEETDSFNEWGSPCFLVSKKGKDGGDRLVTDFRRVNEKLEKMDFVMPNVDVTLASLSGMKYFAKIDIKSAFHCIPIAENCRNYFTICTQSKILRYARVPMGTAVSSHIFQRIINAVLSKYLFKSALSYIDDVVVFNTSYEGLLKDLEEILMQLDKFGFCLNTEKCVFGAKEIELLGHVIKNGTTKPSSRNIEAVEKIQSPKSVKQIKSFLGAVGFYRAYIPNFAKTAMPLTKKLQKSEAEQKFTWDRDCEKAYQTLKKALISEPILSQYSEERENYLVTDACNQGIASALYQLDPITKKMHVIGYYSRKLNKSFKNWGVCDIELLAIVKSLQFWRPWILNATINILSDNKSLIYFKNFKDTNTRLMKLSLAMAEYQIKITHIKGVDNKLSDFLSRNPLNKYLDATEIEFCNNIITASKSEVAADQLKDDYFRNIILAMNDPESADNKFVRLSRNFVQKEGLLYYIIHLQGVTYEALATPEKYRTQVMERIHGDVTEGGHLSHRKLQDKITARFFWPGMKTDFKNFTKRCESCQLRNPERKKPAGEMQPIQVTDRPYTTIIADVLGPLPNSYGYNYALIVVDTTTRYLSAIPLRRNTANTISEAMLNLFSNVGYPSQIITDKGSSLVNRATDLIWKELGITQSANVPYAHNIVGAAERVIGVIKTMLSHFVDEKPNDWSRYMKHIMFTINNAKHTSTGHSASYLLYGYTPRSPQDVIFTTEITNRDIQEQKEYLTKIRKELPEIYKKKSEEYKKQYDARRRTDVEFKPDDLVLIKDHTFTTHGAGKMYPRYHGPFKIIRKINNQTYLVLSRKYGRLQPCQHHVQNIKKYVI